jgi:hypothetical protein
MEASKELFKSSVHSSIHSKMDTTHELIKSILTKRSENILYEVLVSTKDTLIFNYTYPDWDFTVPVICQLIGDTYWLVNQ